MIKTSRLILETRSDRHKDAFAEMNADPEVMSDLGGPISRSQSDAKFERYLGGFLEELVFRGILLQWVQ